MKALCHPWAALSQKTAETEILNKLLPDGRFTAPDTHSGTQKDAKCGTYSQALLSQFAFYFHDKDQQQPEEESVHFTLQPTAHHEVRAGTRGRAGS